MKRHLIAICLSFLLQQTLFSQLIDIPRVNLMPDFPQPYEMRDWKQIAQQYDSLVFNLNSTGTHLPLTTIVSSTNNYPTHPTFGIQSYVGTNSPPGMEAINVLASVVGASLNGIDKSNQFGHNWALYCEEYFNRRASENVYLNGPNSSSGHDWWYETMPNIFFYQVNSFYPHTGDFDHQFITIADRWLQAVKAMGGANTPWEKPYMNYRAFILSDMVPLESGVKQPEAAGALAWILYNAYTETGHEKYRIGAEWCLEFLSGWEDNPSYEIQLPYGVYMAARMNAILGTDYDVEKMLNWCFDVGDLRGWGTIVGNWGENDVSGLVGEAREDFPDYAFNMNGFEHAGALVPMTRYDDRFAKAIGKWVLNLANASRLYYSGFLSDEMQDNEEWTGVYDPESVIAYEALREQKAGPYGTGDAMGGGWAQTNLGLYGSSHVGILGALIQETNISGILQLDLLATDYYGTDAYDSYLYFNPHDQSHNVEISIPSGVWDIWDGILNQIIATNISSTTSISIPSKQPVMVVLIPNGSNITFELNRAFVNDIIIDFNTGENVENYPPRIKSLATNDTLIIQGTISTIYCTAVDRESEDFNYFWAINDIPVEGDAILDWNSPEDTGQYVISCKITDEGNLSDSAALAVRVVEKINYPPVINSISANPRIMNINESSELICHAYDLNDDELTFSWTAQSGQINGTDSMAVYQAPATQGNYYIICTVTDVDGASSTDSLLVLVKDPAQGQSGDLVLKYEFNNSVWDFSGYDNHGTPFNTMYVNDMHNEPESAIRFYQTNSNVIIDNTNELNFQDGISVCFWINITQHYDREAYPISHGNWTTRWKISIGDERLRFTLNGSGGIIDVDSEASLDPNIWYHVVALYNGTDCQLLLNGELDAVKAYQGQINTTTYDLILGQSLPSQSGFDYNGAMDKLRIYNYGISYEQVKEIYEEEISSIVEPYAGQETMQIYPNPATGAVRLRYLIHDIRYLICDLYRIDGRMIQRIVEGKQLPGEYEIEIDVSGLQSGVYFVRCKIGDKQYSKKLIIK